MIPPNDWGLKNCLILSLVVLTAMLALVGLVGVGHSIPVLTQVVGFTFLTFVPGILVLRILRIHNLSSIESLVYSVGLSLAFVMFSGTLADFVLPLLGVSKPISVYPVMGTLAVFTLLLCGIAYRRDREWDGSFSTVNRLDFRKLISLPYLLLLLLPFIAVLGAQLVNLYQNNLLLLIFLGVVALIVALFAFDRLPRNAYPLAIVMIGLSLLLHISLISPQLSGGDVRREYFYENLVAMNGYWDYAFVGPLGDVNTALSIVMLCPIYSIVLNLDAIWVIKVIYPLFFCLVPLALFHVFSGQIGAKKAFFAAILFMAIPMFFQSTVGGIRNQTAQLFFVLLILLMVERKLALNQRIILFLVFSLAMIVSHYGMGYIFTAFLIGGWIIVALIGSRARVIWQWLTTKFGSLPEDIIFDRAFPAGMAVSIIAIYLTFAIVWYGAIAQGAVLDHILGIGQELGTSELADPTLRESLVYTAFGADFFSVSGLGQAFRVFQIITEVFLVVGFITLILRPKGFKAEYIGLTAVAAVILFACVVVPRFSAYLVIDRFYFISLYLIAPLFILGGEVVWRGLSRLFRSVYSRLKATSRLALATSSSDSTYLRFFVMAILIPYFLFNTGFLFELTGSERFGVNDSPSSIALSSYRLDMPVFGKKDDEAVVYLSQIMDEADQVYADRWGVDLLQARLFGRVRLLDEDSDEVTKDGYVFLRTWNVDTQEFLVLRVHGVQQELEHVSLSDRPWLLEGRHIVHDNGSAQIWGPKLTD